MCEELHRERPDIALLQVHNYQRFAVTPVLKCKRPTQHPNSEDIFVFSSPILGEQTCQTSFQESKKAIHMIDTSVPRKVDPCSPAPDPIGPRVSPKLHMHFFGILGGLPPTHFQISDFRVWALVTEILDLQLFSSCSQKDGVSICKSDFRLQLPDHNPESEPALTPSRVSNLRRNLSFQSVKKS